MRGLKKNRYGKLRSSMVMAAMLLAFTGCGSGSYKSADSAASAPMAEAPMENAAGLLDYGYAEYEVTEEYAQMQTEGAADVAQTEGNVPVEVTERKLIKTVDMNVETQSYDELLTTIQSQVTELGGYIESMNTYNGSRYYDYNPTRNADMTIRIPKEKLDAFLNTVSDISNVVRRSDNVEDVTLAYVDLESHRDALRTEQDRLLELLERAETVEDIITIEQRLSDVRYQLESMESQLRTFDNQVDYSTVYLSIEEVEVFTPVEEESVWERISGGFMESLDNIGNGFVEFGIWFVIHIPYLVVWAVIVGAFICLLVWLIKHSTKPPKKSVNNAYGQEIGKQNAGIEETKAGKQE